MARNRVIKPKFWDDAKIGRLTRDARLLYIGLWNFSDDIGVVIGNSIWLKSKIFPYDQIQIQQFEKWMNELVINGFVCLLSYKGERFIYLPNFTRHQVINKPNYEDLNIPKSLIDNAKDEITEQSRNTTVSFTEQYVTKIEIEREEEYPPYNSPQGEEVPSESDESDKINYNALMDTFNKMFEGKLPKITAMTDKRKKAVKARSSEHGKKAIMDVLDNVCQSSFLLGHNNQNWSCDFDWIFRPTNFIKILEGNYNGTRLSKNQQDSEQRKRDSVLAVATTVREAAAKRERNLKQRALLNKYPDPAQFILDYNPDLQFKLVRCNATHSELALNDSIPSLGLLSSTYGDETPIEWLKIQFGSLNDFAEVSTKIAKEQLSELSEIFLSEYYYINAAEICFFIARFKAGKYGRFYGSIDPLKITSAMLDYVSERWKDIERKERERYRNQREKEIEERGNNRISYAEYQELKRRAESGDEKAQKMLISP